MWKEARIQKYCSLCYLVENNQKEAVGEKTVCGKGKYFLEERKGRKNIFPERNGRTIHKDAGVRFQTGYFFQISHSKISISWKKWFGQNCLLLLDENNDHLLWLLMFCEEK